MEQLPSGATAFNNCTLEQLPTGTGKHSPVAAASPVPAGSNSPVVMGDVVVGDVVMGDVVMGPRPGEGRVGLSARNAAAALCSARRYLAEPRNAYRCIFYERSAGSRAIWSGRDVLLTADMLSYPWLVVETLFSHKSS